MPTRARLILRVNGIVGSVVAIGFIITGTACVDSLVLHPSVSPVSAGDARRVEIRAETNRVIEAWVARSYDGSDSPDAYVLCFTGNEQRAEQVAESNADRWSPHRVEAWTVNFPGYGGSTGPARLSAIAPAALCAYDALARQANKRPIYITSNSLGGTAALYVATQRHVAGLIVQNPPALRKVILNQGWWNLWLIALPASLRVPNELDCPTNARDVHAPAIFITATSDNVVMPKFQQLTIDAYAGPKQHLLLQHKGHDDTIDSDQEWKTFRKMLDVLWQQSHDAPNASPRELTTRPDETP